MRQSSYTRFGKRLLDLVLTLPALVLLSPLFLGLALAVRIDSRGSVFYRQERVGRGGRPFMLWKFRSMVVGAEAKGARTHVERNDPRITAVGTFLRRWSLDELPQLFNVLAGPMSLIGPRPGLPYQAEQYDANQRRRLLVKPGITGWAQIHGRNAIPWERRIELDIEYVGRCSFGTDLRILWRTLPVVTGGQDRIAARAYFEQKPPDDDDTAPDRF